MNQHLPIGELRPELKRTVSVTCIILQCFKVRPSAKQGETVYPFLAADDTGCVNLDIWGDPGPYVKEGDILHIVGGETKLYNKKLYLTLSRKYGKMTRVGQYNPYHVVTVIGTRYRLLRAPTLVRSSGCRQKTSQGRLFLASRSKVYHKAVYCHVAGLASQGQVTDTQKGAMQRSTHYLVVYYS
jgi:hypothetical protein